MENVIRQSRLSPKEGQVLLHGIAGLSDKEIAQEMGIALDTVRIHWQRIRGKVGCRTRTGVVARIVREWARTRIEESESENEALLLEIARCDEVKRRFHAMADAAPLGIFTTDEEGRCTYANPAYLAISGITSEQAEGNGWVRSIYAEDRDRVFAEWDAYAKIGGRYQSEHRFTRPDNTVLWASVTASPIVLDRQLRGHIGVVKEITERKLSQELLRQRARMAHDIAEATLDAFFVFEPYIVGSEITDFRFAYVSRNAEILFGRSGEELLGTLLTESFPGPEISEYVKAYRDVLDTGVPFEVEARASGHIEGNLLSIRASRVADGVGVAVRDVTEIRRLQREAEARTQDLERLNDRLRESNERIAGENALLDAILSIAGCLVCVFDSAGRFVRFNRECERLTGWTEEEVRGETAFERMVPEDLHDQVRSRTSEMATDDHPISYEHDWQTKGGERRRIEWRTTILRGSTGEVGYIVATGMDVTDRRAAEAELRAAKEALEDAQRIAGLGSWEYEVGTGTNKWSLGMFELFDYPPSEVPPSFQQSLERVHPDDVPFVLTELQKSTSDWTDTVFTHRIVSPGGETRYVTCSSKADRERGVLYGTVQDVTERVFWESQLEEAMMRTVEESVLLEVQKEALLEANQRLDRLSITDGLTELLNHRAFQERLDEELQRARRHGTSLSLILLDVDHFKRFNDDYGHQEGDRVLKGVATTLREHARGTDIVARYGGEEFAVILPHTAVAEAKVAAERLRTAIYEYPWPGFSVTASFGVATWDPELTQEALIKRSDRALYEAKRTGRNRIVHTDGMKLCGPF